jgi:hypothetical protein
MVDYKGSWRRIPSEKLETIIQEWKNNCGGMELFYGA